MLIACISAFARQRRRSLRSCDHTETRGLSFTYRFHYRRPQPGAHVRRERTVTASIACAFIEFAISRGASRQALLQRSGIDPAVLRGRDNRFPFGKYVALVRAGQELCNTPALALHFGEAVDCSEIAVPVGGVTNMRDVPHDARRGRHGIATVRHHELAADDWKAVAFDNERTVSGARSSSPKIAR